MIFLIHSHSTLAPKSALRNVLMRRGYSFSAEVATLFAASNRQEDI